MSKEIMERIKAAEEEAKRIRDGADERVGKVLKGAEAEGKEMIREAEEAGREELSGVKREVDTRDAIEEGEKEAKEMRMEIKAKLKKASEMIVEEIVKKCQ